MKLTLSACSGDGLRDSGLVQKKLRVCGHSHPHSGPLQSTGRGRIVLRRSAYPSVLVAVRDGSDYSLSRRTGEGQGEVSFVRNSPPVRQLFLQKPLAGDPARNGCHPLFCAFLVLTLSARTFAAATPIRFAGQNAELVLSEVSERTLRVELFPFDEQGRSRPAAPSTVLVPFPFFEKLRARQIT